MIALILAWISVGCLILADVESDPVSTDSLKRFCREEQEDYYGMVFYAILFWPIVVYIWYWSDEDVE